jgi:hypothetical protein
MLAKVTFFLGSGAVPSRLGLGLVGFGLRLGLMGLGLVGLGLVGCGLMDEGGLRGLGVNLLGGRVEVGGMCITGLINALLSSVLFSALWLLDILISILSSFVVKGEGDGGKLLLFALLAILMALIV